MPTLNSADIQALSILLGVIGALVWIGDQIYLAHKANPKQPILDTIATVGTSTLQSIDTSPVGMALVQALKESVPSATLNALITINNMAEGAVKDQALKDFLAQVQNTVQTTTIATQPPSVGSSIVTTNTTAKPPAQG